MSTKTRMDPDFFLILCKANPKAALENLERTMAKASRDKLLRFTSGRREAVRALERIARFKDLFARASRLLLRLAEAENEIFTNNATQAFLTLFDPESWGNAHEEANPGNRIHVLRSAMDSDSVRLQILAIKACGAALATTTVVEEADTYSGIVGASAPFRWQRPDPPRPWPGKEVTEYRQTVLGMLAERLDRNDDCVNEAVRMMMAVLGSLHMRPEIAGSILDVIERMRKNHLTDDEVLLRKIIILAGDDGSDDSSALDPETQRRLKLMHDDISGADFHSRMRRYVGMNIIIDPAGRHDHDLREDEIESLAAQSTDPDVLQPELQWLVTDEAKYGYVFGYRLAQKDAAYVLLPGILAELRHAGERSSGFFIGGYLARMYECDVERWEDELDCISCDPVLRPLLPEITYRSGMTGRAAERIGGLVRTRSIERVSLGVFRYGKAVNKVPEVQFAAWISLLLDDGGDDELFIALDLFHAYYVRANTKLPRQLALDLLLHPHMMSGYVGRLSPVGDLCWKETCLALAEQHPDAGMHVLRTILENSGAAGIITDRGSQARRALDEIVRTHPKGAWGVISNHIDTQTDPGTYGILRWLKTGPLSCIPMSAVLAWVAEDEDLRIDCIAMALPPRLEAVREFLSLYGDRGEVKRRLSMSFNSGSWIGSGEAHYAAQRRQFEEMKAKETNPNILSWLDYHMNSLDDSIRRAEDVQERLS